MDEDSRRESLRLWDVLERVGVTERMRQLHRDTSICSEILKTVTKTMKGGNISTYYFGSSSEGTTTPGMHSDCDMVYCYEYLPVIDDIQQSIPGRCLLTQNDLHTRPGYVKLQEVRDGTPLTIHNCNISHPLIEYDCDGRVCMRHIIALGEVEGINERSGPADTQSNRPGFIDTDFVEAYRSRSFPRAATQSLLECIRSGWLTRYDAERMMSFGCLFVGVGHPASDEKEIEWRVSFSLQERQLMFSLNQTQHKCYVLLKLIKNMLTSQFDGEKCITSYHCKTCVFRSICKIGLEHWKPENLIHCTFICLDELLQCLCNNDCPNLFIKTNNMFERRFSGEVRERLIHSIRDMLQEGFRLFYRIQSDNIGEAFRGRVSRYIEWNLSIQKYNIYQNTYRDLVYCQVDICRYLNTRSDNAAARYLSHQICYLTYIDTITEHTHEETKTAVSCLIPIMHKLYSQHLASLAFSTDMSVSRHHLLQASARHLRLGMTWDLMSGRLLYATILYRQGHIDLCRRVLEQIEQTLNGAVVSVCMCHEYAPRLNDLLWTCIQSGNTDPQSIMKRYVAACTIFLPAHSQIIPTALQYEMYRSVCTQPGSRDDRHDFWFGCVALDSKVYLYFMQYIVSTALNKPERAQFAINDLDRVLMLDETLGHRETGYNLLGWIHIQEGRIREALVCFIQSWTIRPNHNAAKWHVLLQYQHRASLH